MRIIKCMDENTSNTKTIKNRKRLSVFFNVMLIFLSVVALCVAGVLFYQKRYLSPFWVNGQSMYPTFNMSALDANGNLYGETGGSTRAGSTKIDYGVMDKHERALKKIKRFDIVVCKYNDYDATDKIKRVVGLPGETIKFGLGSNNGDLYVKGENGFQVVEQPLESKYIKSGFYPAGEIELKENEYYVLGDNRAHSNDSRNPSNGPVKYEWLIGKVVAICAYCDISQNKDGSFEPTNIDYFSPRFL